MCGVRRIIAGFLLTMAVISVGIAIPLFADTPAQAATVASDCDCDDDCADATGTCMASLPCHMACSGTMAADLSSTSPMAGECHLLRTPPTAAYHAVDWSPPLHP